MPTVFASAGIWSSLELRRASLAVAAAASASDARSTPTALAAMHSTRPAAVATTSASGGMEWTGRGAQLQANVATQRAMQRREEERERGTNPAAASAAALAARVAAQAASAASAAPLSWMSPPAAALPSSLPLYSSFISPVKLSRRDQLILSTFEWGHRPQPAYMPAPLTSPQSAPSKSEVGDAERTQQKSGSRAASRAAETDRSQLHRSRSTGAAAARQPRATPASTSFAPAVSPLSHRTGDVSSLLGVTPLDKTHAASRNARSDPLLLSDYSDPMLSSPHAPLPLHWATGPRDAYLDSLAHTKLRMQMESAAAAQARLACNNELTPCAHQRPIDSSSRSGVSSNISAALSGDLSPLPHSSLRNDQSSSSDASRWQHSSDHSSLLLLTHLSDSPADYS